MIRWALVDVALIVVGVAVVVAGIAYWSKPAAVVVGGLALIALGVLPMRPRRS